MYKLSDRIKEAEELRDHLLTLKRFAHDVLDMKQTTISEIHRYSIPSSLIFNVMKATFLLLGEHPQNLEVCFEVWKKYVIINPANKINWEWGSFFLESTSWLEIFFFGEGLKAWARIYLKMYHRFFIHHINLIIGLNFLMIGTYLSGSFGREGLVFPWQF